MEGQIYLYGGSFRTRMNEQDGHMVGRMAGLRRYQLLFGTLIYLPTQRMDELMDETMAVEGYGTVGAGDFVLQTTTTPLSCTLLQVVQLLQCVLTLCLFF